MMTTAPRSKLNDAVLSKRQHLPIKPDPIFVTGQYVRLAPVDLEKDPCRLFKMINGQALQLGERLIEAYDPNLSIWQYMFDGPFDTEEDLYVSLQAQVNASNGLCLCVFDATTDQPIGVANYMNNFPMHLKMELGAIWYSPVAQRSLANTEATYLMLQHTFTMGYRRIEWKCDALNERSRKAALRLGFQFEGIQESHFIVKNCNRDTAWYRILDAEWPIVKERLEKTLYQS